MSFKQFQRWKDFFCFLEELATAHLEQVRAFDCRDILLFQFCHHEFGFLDAEIGSHHRVRIGRMGQKVFADLDCLVHGGNGYFSVSVIHIRTMKQSGDSEHCTDILARPVGDGLSLSGQKLFVLLKVVRSDRRLFQRDAMSAVPP